MGLLRSVFWFGLFFLLTFCFVVLFEYGPHDFANGAQKQHARVNSLVLKRIEGTGKRTDEQTAVKTTAQQQRVYQLANVREILWRSLSPTSSVRGGLRV